jgi:hypothetical protein
VSAPAPSAHGPLYRSAWVLYLALAILGVVGFGAARGTIGIAAFVDPGNPALDLAGGVAMAALLLGLWALGRRLFAAGRAVEVEIATLLGPLSREEALALALLSGVAEEIFFRGALQAWLGWLPAALAFGLLHIGPRKEFRLWTAFAVVAGLLFGLWVELRGALGAPILAHVLTNGVQLARLRRMAPPPARPAPR